MGASSPNSGNAADEAPVRNSACYKAVGEVLNAHHALRTGEHRYARAAAFEADDSWLATRLREIAARRFLPVDERVVEETLRFLLNFYVDLWAGFGAQPFVPVDRNMRQRVDCPPAETDDSELEAATCRRCATIWTRTGTGPR